MSVIVSNPIPNPKSQTYNSPFSFPISFLKSVESTGWLWRGSLRSSSDGRLMMTKMLMMITYHRYNDDDAWCGGGGVVVLFVVIVVVVQLSFVVVALSAYYQVRTSLPSRIHSCYCLLLLILSREGCSLVLVPKNPWGQTLRDRDHASTLPAVCCLGLYCAGNRNAVPVETR